MLFMAYPYIKQHYSDTQCDPINTGILPILCQNKMRNSLWTVSSTHKIFFFPYQQEKTMLFTVQSYDKRFPEDAGMKGCTEV